MEMWVVWSMDLVGDVNHHHVMNQTIVWLKE